MTRLNQFSADSSLDFSQLESISLEVYGIVTQKQIPFIFLGMMNCGKWSSREYQEST